MNYKLPCQRLSYLLLLLCCTTFSFAQLTNLRELNDGKSLELVEIKPDRIRFEKVVKMAGAPDVDVSIEPSDGDYLLYHLTPGFSFQEGQKAQLSLLAYLHNKETSSVDLDKVVIKYNSGNTAAEKTITLPSDKLVIGAGAVKGWQNSRPYHESGDVVYLDAPFPTQVTIQFHYKGKTMPVTVTKKIKPFTTGFALPFKSADLRKDEYLSSYSMHGGGGQVFAYDIGVEGYNNGWSGVLPGTDGTKNADFRIWGKPVYAMADGIVLHTLNDCENNPKPYPSGMTKEESDALGKWQQDNLWGKKEHGGGGNHFYIRHGNLVALYAHMQKGSLNSKFLAKGTAVKKGDFLGYAGNSGSSTAPHTHIHVNTYTNDNEPEGGYYRPLVFNNGYVIGKTNYTSPMSNVNWSKLDNEGIPGLQGKGSFIWPSDKHLYCAYATGTAEVAKHGVSSENYQEEFDKIWPCGYYPVWVDGYDVNGKTFFNMIFRPAAGVQWVARHNMSGDSYQTEFTKWSNAGYNILYVDSYLRNGQVNYAAVWKKDSRVTMAYHGTLLAQHEANFKKNTDAGWVPVNISCVNVSGKIYVTALWEKKSTGGFYARPVMTLEEYKAAFKQYTDTEKFKLAYINAYTLNGKPAISAVWYRNISNYNTWYAKHYLTPAGYQTEFNTYTGQGYQTRCVTGYEGDNGHRFEGVWSK